MSTAAYVRYDDAVEVVQPDEEATIGEVLEVFHRLQTLTFEKHRHAVRAAHAKSHGILRGTLTVLGGLAAPLAQGLFAAARAYPVIVRLSTAPGDILADGIASFRGLALKVIGVDGPKLLPELADAVTQDLLFVNHPAFPTGDVRSFLSAQVAFFREQGAVYEVRAQLCTDLETMPVEDASVRWPEDDRGSPYQTVARLEIPAQEAYSPERRVYADEVLAFSPWQGLRAHRPLGSIMRVRRRAYDASARFRHAMNARRASEPRSIDEFPA